MPSPGEFAAVTCRFCILTDRDKVVASSNPSHLAYRWNFMNVQSLPVVRAALACLLSLFILGGCISSAKQAPVPPEAVATPAPAFVDSDGDGVADDQDACPGTPPGVTVDHKGCEVLERLDSTYFEYDSAALTQSATAALNRVAAKIMQHSDRKFEIAGHTDSMGTEEYNNLLGQRRAIAVVEFLRRAGVPAERLVVRSYGKTQPIAPNTRPDGSDDPEGRALNRRVEIIDLAM